MQPKTTLRRTCLALSLLTASCAKYEYDVIQPKVAEPHVDPKHDVAYDAGPVSYRFTNYDSRLVVRIYNQTEDKLEIAGSHSAVVDPTGQSHPVPTQPIPPHAFVRLVLPPVRPQFVTNGGPAVYGPGLNRGEFGFGGYYDEPRTYTLRDDGQTYWDWDGETTARLTVTIRQGARETTQEFTLGRRRAR